MQFNRTPRHRRQEGFTLIELLVVIAILGILATVATFAVVKQVDRARVAKAKTEIGQFKMAVDKYYLDTGRYPEGDQGLRALFERPADEKIAKLWDGPYLTTEALPLDPWKNDYIYRTTDSDLIPYEIVCYGKDGVEGGEGTNADITSRNLAD